MKGYKWLALGKEAYLFDAKSYLLKSFLAVLTAYILAIRQPLLQLDRISILFALMMCLEPVSKSGLRSGWNQILATSLGAFTTMMIISFLGINSFTVAFSVCFTLYVCLRINWRVVSPVAIFTSIYMTQYVQLNIEGMPSPYLTLRLRVLALLFGVAVAAFYNFVFSLIAYKKLPSKRFIYILEDQLQIGEVLRDVMVAPEEKTLLEVQARSLKAFETIDWVLAHLKDLESDYLLEKQRRSAKSYRVAIQCLREMNHTVMDSTYYLKEQTKSLPSMEMVAFYETCLRRLEHLKCSKEVGMAPIDAGITKDNRLEQNIIRINQLIERIDDVLYKEKLNLDL